MSNCEWVASEYDPLPVIMMRKPPHAKLHRGIYTEQGVPTCIGQVPMEYVRSDPDKGHVYRCRQDGCVLKGRRGVRYCDTEIWDKPDDDLRLFGPLRRENEEWRSLYSMRQRIERVFKGLRESRHWSVTAYVATADQPPHDDVGPGVPGDGPDPRAGRGGGGYAVDGEEGCLVREIDR